MRSDIPQELAEKLKALPPDLRPAVEAAIDAQYPTEEQAEQDRRVRELEARRRDARHHQKLAGKVDRALQGEWGDDVRRAVNELVSQVRQQVDVLIDWHRRRFRKAITKIEWVAIRQAFESSPVRWALAAAQKPIREAEKERRETTKR